MNVTITDVRLVVVVVVIVVVTYSSQRVAALVPVQGLSSLFPSMHCFFDPSCTFVRFSVQNCSGWSINHMVMHFQSMLTCSAQTDLMHVGFW